MCVLSHGCERMSTLFISLSSLGSLQSPVRLPGQGTDVVLRLAGEGVLLPDGGLMSPVH